MYVICKVSFVRLLCLSFGSHLSKITPKKKNHPTQNKTNKPKKKTGEHNSASVRHHLTSELRPKQPTRNDACCRT